MVPLRAPCLLTTTHACRCPAVATVLPCRAKLDVVLARQAQLQQLCIHHGIPVHSSSSRASSYATLSNGADAFVPASSAVPQPATVAA